MKEYWTVTFERNDFDHRHADRTYWRKSTKAEALQMAEVQMSTGAFSLAIVEHVTLVKVHTWDDYWKERDKKQKRAKIGE